MCLEKNCDDKNIKSIYEYNDAVFFCLIDFLNTFHSIKLLNIESDRVKKRNSTSFLDDRLFYLWNRINKNLNK